MPIDVQELAKNAQIVFEDCLLPNGCLVAAPVHQSYYPSSAKSYLYSWPGRDAGFALAAMLLIGKDYYEPVLRWLWERAEDFQMSDKAEFTGLILRDYHVNGLAHIHQFQPDQGATLLWSLAFKKQITAKPLTQFEQDIVKHLADNLVRVWDGASFTMSIEELWEERGLKSEEGLFVYSAAAVSKALQVAGQMTSTKKYSQAADQIKKRIHEHAWHKDKGLARSFGGTLDYDLTIDGSMSGLVWPFGVDLPKAQLEHTVDRIIKELTSFWGVHRYPDDAYEGVGEKAHNHDNEKAGAWPLLTFWLSIACKELGREKQAQKYFDLVFDKLPDRRYIPEQLFCCETVPWVGIKPLLWSHAMAVFAAWKLGHLQVVNH